MVPKIKKYLIKKGYRLLTLKGQFVIWSKESKKELKQEFKEDSHALKQWAYQKIIKIKNYINEKKG
jgi:hypothetical protein